MKISGNIDEGMLSLQIWKQFVFWLMFFSISNLRRHQ